MKLLGKVAIITGGGTGIGKATAILLAQQGAKIAVCGRRDEFLKETVNLIEQIGGEAIAIVTDVQDIIQVNQMVNKVLAKFGQIDILINNAGIAIAKPFIEHTELDWDNILNINLKGVFLTCQEVLPQMITTHSGVVINVSSILGKSGISSFSAYCASKFGIIGLTQSLAAEYRTQNIRLYSVCPGRTNTDMQRQLGGQKIADLSMPPEKVATKIVNLINGKLSLPSGSNIVVDRQSMKLTIYEISEKFKPQFKKLLKPFFFLRQQIKNFI